MDAQINYTIADGTNLSKKVDEKLPLLKAEGFDEENNVKLKTGITALTAAEKTQSGAVNATDNKIAAKETIVAKAIALIKRLRDAARASYQDNSPKLKQYKIDDPISMGVNSLCSFCEYLGQIAEAEISVLSRNGFNQSDLTELLAIAEQIRNAASDRRSAIKEQKAATIIRNDAAEVVEKLCKKIRRFVKARFSDKPEILVLFEPITKGRGSAGGDDEEKKTENPDGTKK
jgi:hypothetical protein